MTELNLGEAVSRAVAERLDAAFVEKEVETRVGKLVVEAVDKALRSYSDTGKLIDEAVGNALRVNSLDLPSYGHIVSKMLKTQIEARVSDLVAGHLAQNMEELLNLAPKEVRLSKIADEMREAHTEGYGPVITCFVERSDRVGSFSWVYLDEEEHREERDKYQCRHRLLVGEDGVIAGGWIDNNNLKAGNWIGRAYGLAQKLRAYIACGTKLILDDDAVVVSVGDY